MKIETIAVHAGNSSDDNSGAVIQPISLSTTYQRSADGSYAEGYIYSRIDNPNRRSLENVITKLENGEDACAFSSGNAAAAALFQALGAGSHIIAPDDMYHGLRNQILQVFEGVIEVDFADMSKPEAVRELIRSETKLIWVESPSNPLLKVTDIESIVRLAKEGNTLVACDNTFSTPIFQRPLDLGCDFVMHSTTKYLSGHSDVLGGVLVSSKKSALWEKIRSIQVLGGAVPSPFDCYLTVRGIKTLPYRMKGHDQNGAIVAEYLSKHKMVEQVFYPGLTGHPGHEIAGKQMKGFGGMLSFLVKGGPSEARQVVNSLKIFTQATSLGGVESLVEHRASVEGPYTKTPQNLIRVSVGIENADDLISDLENALQVISS